MNPQIEIQLIAIAVSLSCSILGVFLTLRKMAMMADAISHTIFFGIVVAFFITHDINSPLLIIGAVLTGTFTVILVEWINKTKLVGEDASIGLVFPLLFSIGVILISIYADDVHLCVDSVLLGEIAFAPFDRIIIKGLDIGPKSLYIMLTILLINIIYVILFYKELKLSTFDPGLSLVLGISPSIIHYSFMPLVSLTAVGAFDAVGSILVLAFMIGPPITAYLLTNNLKMIILLSGIIGIASSVLGYWLAHLWDVTIGGMMAVMVGVFFSITFLVAPDKGLISIIRRKKKQRYDFAKITFLLHILNHQGTEEENDELGLNTIHNHLVWDTSFLQNIMRLLIDEEYIYIDDNVIKITKQGEGFAMLNYKRIINSV